MGPGGRTLDGQTIDEFAAQPRRGHRALNIPKSIKRVKFVQDDAETLVVKLPCKELLDQGEAIAKAGGDYPLPAFDGAGVRSETPGW